jgi:hypothetical protein
MMKLFALFLLAIVGVTMSAQEFSIQIDSVTPNRCGGGNDACIHVTLTGGTAPYSFTWTRGIENPVIVSNEEDPCGLIEGFYFLKVYDADSLLAETYDPVIVIDPVQIIVSYSISRYGDFEVSAYGAHDGYIMITYGKGGTGNWMDFTYKWTNEQGWTKQTGNIISNLPAGTYFLTVYDQSGCKNPIPVMGDPSPFILTQPGPETLIDTVPVYDTIIFEVMVPVYDTTLVTVYDTTEVIRFTEVAEVATLYDPVSGATFSIKNFGDHLESSEPFVECKVYNLRGSLVRQVNSSTEVPVGELSGIYLFYFRFGAVEIVQRFLIE